MQSAELESRLAHQAQLTKDAARERRSVVTAGVIHTFTCTAFACRWRHAMAMRSLHSYRPVLSINGAAQDRN